MINNTELIRMIEEEEEGTTLDYKEILKISTAGEKANFVKDIVSLANSGETSHIIVGVEDVTRKLIGIRSGYKLETLNQILKDKTDPPLRIEYKETTILGCLVGVIEIDGSNAPYIISVPDRYGSICRGTIYVRNMNMNEGAIRADIDRIYNRMKPIILESDIHLSCEMSMKPVVGMEELIEVTINFKLHNYGDAIATDTYIWAELTNVEKIIKCDGDWYDQSAVNEGRNVVSQHTNYPIIKGVWVGADSLVVQMKKETKEINAYIRIGASNMRTRSGECTITIAEDSEEVAF